MQRIRHIRNITLCIIFLLPGAVFGESARLSDDIVLLLYESRAGTKTPDSKLAEYLSSDYKNARDSRTKHTILERIKPKIQQRIDRAKNTQDVFFIINGTLGDYDSGNEVFSTQFEENGFIPFKNEYAVTFTNVEHIKSIPVPKRRAKTVSDSLKNDNGARYFIYGTIAGAKEKELNWSTKKTIELKVTKLEVKLYSGVSVGAKVIE